jgi:uncharacterized protein
MSNEMFHEGEIAVQERTGERAMACRYGAAISSRIIPGALPFLLRQRLVAVSALGRHAELWTSVWCGDAGFIGSVDGQLVRFERSLMRTSRHDAVQPHLGRQDHVGILAIDFASGGRLRINGTVASLSGSEIEILVRESVPNCPKYIRHRRPHAISPTTEHAPHFERGRKLDPTRRRLIEQADTSFVGSLHPARGVDVSHRGGAPGFIQIVDGTTLRVPDYHGNSMFMTLGNFEIDPRAGLAVLDFERNRIASFSGTAQVCFDVRDRPGGSGTGRWWEFSIREWVEHDLSPTMRWELA